MSESPIIYEELKSPVTAQLELTYNCTNKCSYCYNSWRGKKHYNIKEMSLEESLDICKKLVGAEIFEVVLTGGEPLLRRDVLYPCANYLSSKNIDVKLNTNLVPLKEEDCSMIKSSGITSVFASLCSYDKGTYNEITNTKAFGKAVKGLELLIEHKIPVGINMVVIQRNKSQIYETGRFLSNMGVKFFSATPASSCEYMDKKLELKEEEVVETLDTLLALKKDIGMHVDIVEPLPRCLIADAEKYEAFLKRDCAAGKITIAISPSAEVRPCTHVSQKYGNLLAEELSKIWEKMQDWRKGDYIPKDCFNCQELEICSLGCREAAKIETGSYNGTDPWANTSLKENRKKLLNFELDGKENFRIVKNLRFREEKKGYFLFSSRDHSALYANPSLFRIISTLSKMGDFNIQQIKEKFQDENIVSIIKYLKARGLIETW